MFYPINAFFSLCPRFATKLKTSLGSGARGEERNHLQGLDRVGR